MTATSIEQSQHLLELGLDPKTADMSYSYFDDGEPGLDLIPYMLNSRMAIPAWSFDALLEVMRKLYATITLQIIGNSTFLRIKDNGFMLQKDIHVKNPMDAVYGGMLWLLEQGLIKKGEQNDEKGI